jgi:tetratricopeptide (TPR) repeat protein
MAADKRLALLKRANKLFRQGKTDASVKEYQKILSIKSDDLEVRRILGDLQLRQNNIPEAVEQFNWIADYYNNEGFFAKAIAMYKRITRIDPRNEQSLFKLADLYSKQGLVIEAKQIYLDMAEECKRQNDQKKALGMYKKILEFDRTNTKMRILLADNYLKEKMEKEAIEEYLTSADILFNKKDFRQGEELLLSVLKKVKHNKLYEKLLYTYISQQEEEKAIRLIKNLDSKMFENVNLLKMLGDLYIKKNLIEEAEKIFKKISEINPEEIESVMRLGKVYLQREEYDKTYDLFLPIVDNNINIKKYEEAASLLRFIIASNTSYLPALTKLGSIFKISGKTNNLIALYESLIPIYEKEGMKDELKEILEELIKLSDTPFSYEELLDKITGKEKMEKEEAEEQERESEFISFNLRVVDEALKVSEYEKAINTLIRSKSAFPSNIEVRSKLFEVYQANNQIEEAVEEGKELLDIYKSQNNEEMYQLLFDKLNQLNPEDEKLIEISGKEKTNIEIDIDREELAVEIDSLSGASGDKHEKFEEQSASDDDLLVLSEDQSMADSGAVSKEEDQSKSLASYLSELDFYINDRYFGDAEKLIEGLKKKYPDSKELLARIEKLNSEKQTQAKSEAKEKKPEKEKFDLKVNLPPDQLEKREKESVESENEAKIDDFVVDMPLPGDPLLEADSNSKTGIEMPIIEESLEVDLKQEEISESEESQTNSGIIDLGESDEPVEIPLEEEVKEDKEDKDEFEISRSISEESIQVQEHEDSKAIDKVDVKPPKPEPEKKEEFSELEGIDFEVEVDEPKKPEELPPMEIDKDELVQPATGDAKMDSREVSKSFLEIESLDLDNVFKEESSARDLESPFKDISGPDLSLDDSEEDLLQDEAVFIEEAYFETENAVEGELESFKFWLKEVEKQRTSTIEKNMIEIFDEFKKGVDEKIGQEDYDTRYNLGIAYKEMGLLEEAIHEFLISSKHPSKFFDSAGLLGMCFREKGLYAEAINWFERASQIPDRKKEEYLAIKFELVLTFRLQEDYKSAKKMAEEIIQVNPDFRGIHDIFEDIKSHITD